ncbi:MAG: response regulator [Candidatus Melainabacteria bacterium]|nr:response regulator [Candidatus Melainabacteria bacterium]
MVISAPLARYVKSRKEAVAVPDHGVLNVLVADDSPLQRTMLALLLKQSGHNVSLAADGLEALQLTRGATVFDLILLDCRMPVLGGLDTARLIRAAEVAGQPRHTIVGVSSSASAEQCYAAGMDEFFEKPLKRHQLQSVLARRLRFKRGSLGSQLTGPRFETGSLKCFCR